MSQGKIAFTEEKFTSRHNGVSGAGSEDMAKEVGFNSLEGLIQKAIPQKLCKPLKLNLPDPIPENRVLDNLKEIANENKIFKSYLGLGYYGTVMPAVIRRNILENPSWYTAYTPYQAEISQGRMEALVNFQTMITDLTGMDISNASLLDEATACAEAMNLFYHRFDEGERRKIFVSQDCFPQTIEVISTRANPLGIEVVVGDHKKVKINEEYFCVLLQYPAKNGEVYEYAEFIDNAHQVGAYAVVSADLLSLTILTPPGEFGADAVTGSSQRFGLPMGYGGPHAGYMSVKDEFKRDMPGRLIGVSKDSRGLPAYRLSLQTREQHIRREKATSNICTAQVLLAVLSSMYGVYHGPDGLRRIAERIHLYSSFVKRELSQAGYTIINSNFFDTLEITGGKKSATQIITDAEKSGINLNPSSSSSVSLSVGEDISDTDILNLLAVFGIAVQAKFMKEYTSQYCIPEKLVRKSKYMTHPVFHKYTTETGLMRYMKKLESRDLSLTASMIPLGSCTMKLNAAVEMLPITWDHFANIHPFAPQTQTQGYRKLIGDLENWLGEITGFPGVSLQPNAGSQGEYAGLLAVHNYFIDQGEKGRDICLIPVSAHGTNPASAAMAGFRVVPVACDSMGNVDTKDLSVKINEHKKNLALLMITYPSTHGVFEETIMEICEAIHSAGAFVYMDGANMNAQTGIMRPADLGADVCHLNLHKTFAIPHGGGGPGIGPVCVSEKLKKYLPGHFAGSGEQRIGGTVSAAPYGSASILPISWVYISMLGQEGLALATKTAILNANYIAKKLSSYFPVLYKGPDGLVAHECILDLRPYKKSVGVEAEDVAKRLMDYGFHAPTMSFPVPGTLMVEPTESESRDELDRFIEAMISIYYEIREIEEGKADSKNNVLKNAPHTADMIASDTWDRPYSREKAAYPVKGLRDFKFWPYCGRVDNVWGDRNLFCSCVLPESFKSS